MEVARGEYGTCPAPTLKFLVLLLSNVVVRKISSTRSLGMKQGQRSPERFQLSNDDLTSLPLCYRCRYLFHLTSRGLH
jgi:hypothetical protein